MDEGLCKTWRHPHLSKRVDTFVPSRHVAYVDVYFEEGVLHSRLFERNFSLEQVSFSDARFKDHVNCEGTPYGRTPRTSKLVCQKQTLQVFRRERLTVAVYKVICCVRGMGVVGMYGTRIHTARSL